MGRTSIPTDALEAQIADLRTLSLPDLRERWRTLYGTPAPRSLRRELLIRAIAYQMQVKAYGGLSASYGGMWVMTV
jgi:hypothetical protein